jgi:hypothetical protein
MGYVLHSVPAQTQTSFNIILGLSSVMRVAPASQPSCLSNFPAALVSLTNSCTASLKHLVNFSLDSAMPACTSAWLFKQVHAYLVYLWGANTELFLPNQFAVHTATIQAFVMSQLALGFPLRIDGSGPIRTIRRWAPFVILFATHPRSTQQHWIW